MAYNISTMSFMFQNLMNPDCTLWEHAIILHGLTLQFLKELGL